MVNRIDDPAHILRHARYSAGLSQAQLARRLGISQAAVAKLEREGANPTVRTLHKALQATGHELTLEARKQAAGVDPSLIRRHLELTPAQRLRELEAMSAFAQKLTSAGGAAVANAPELRLENLLRCLVTAGVDFVVVGDVAVFVQANSRFMSDLDICYALDQDNLDRLGEVLVQLQARLATIDEDLPFVPDGRTLRRTQILTLTTSEGAIDLLAKPDGCPDYETLRDRATTIDIDGVEVLVASIEDLIAMKRAAGRPQDLIDVEAVEVARERATAEDDSQSR